MALTFSDENRFVDQQLLFNVKVLATNAQIKEELKKVQEILSSGLKTTEIREKEDTEKLWDGTYQRELDISFALREVEKIMKEFFDEWFPELCIRISVKKSIEKVKLEIFTSTGDVYYDFINMISEPDRTFDVLEIVETIKNEYNT